MTRAIRIGVTGKIGSGKSTLLRIMAERGMTVVNTDLIARNLMESDKELRTQIIALLGSEAYCDDALNRAYVASMIFHDAALREKLEAIVHPAVTREVEFVFQNSEPGKMVAVESALILHFDFQAHFDYIILIDSSDEESIARLRSSRTISEEDARARLAEQHYESVPRDEADFVIENNGTQEDFEKRCGALLAMLDVITMRTLPEEPLHSIEEEE